MTRKKVLIVGESWVVHMTHIKGFDTFQSTKYEEGVGYLREAIVAAGYEVVYLPNHLASADFPYTVEEMQEYACIIFSDVGSNTLLLPDTVFYEGNKKPDRLAVLRDYVEKGGGFLMIGGYMSFSGIDAKARYGRTAVADILPVRCLNFDDRAEHPEGVYPEKKQEHEVLAGLPDKWPHFLGYNVTHVCPDGEVLMEINGDPFIATRKYGKGRTAVFTSDCAPHWGSPDFINWAHYSRVWGNLLTYLCG